MAEDGIVGLLEDRALFGYARLRGLLVLDVGAGSTFFIWIHPICLGVKVTLSLYLSLLIGLVLDLFIALDRNCCSLHAWDVNRICA